MNPQDQNTIPQAVILSHLVLLHRAGADFPIIMWCGKNAQGYQVGQKVEQNLRRLNGVVPTNEGPYSPKSIAIVNGKTENFVWGAFAANAVEQPEAASLFSQRGDSPFFAQYTEKGIEYLAIG